MDQLCTKYLDGNTDRWNYCFFFQCMTEQLPKASKLCHPRRIGTIGSWIKIYPPPANKRLLTTKAWTSERRRKRNWEKLFLEFFLHVRKLRLGKAPVSVSPVKNERKVGKVKDAHEASRAGISMTSYRALSWRRKAENFSFLSAERFRSQFAKQQQSSCERAKHEHANALSAVVVLFPYSIPSTRAHTHTARTLTAHAKSIIYCEPKRGHLSSFRRSLNSFTSHPIASTSFPSNIRHK